MLEIGLCGPFLCNFSNFLLRFFWQNDFPLRGYGRGGKISVVVVVFCSFPIMCFISFYLCLVQLSWLNQEGCLFDKRMNRVSETVKDHHRRHDWTTNML